jgi:midasin
MQFVWSDGALVCAMKTGAVLLLDEISLAPDAVLERLNPLLEPHRTLTITEPAAASDNSNNGAVVVCAHENFKFMATMNPGSDYGKKEVCCGICVGCFK